MKNNNEAVGGKTRLDKSGGGKRLVYHFTNNDFWKCIGCIILVVQLPMGLKYTIFGKTETCVGKKGRNPIHIDICGKIYLLKV